MSRLQRSIRWQVWGPLALLVVAIGIATLGLWEIIRPYAGKIVLIVCIVFGMAIGSHLLMLFLLDRPSKQGIPPPPERFLDVGYWFGPEGFPLLCLALLGALVTTILILLVVATLIGRSAHLGANQTVADFASGFRAHTYTA